MLSVATSLDLPMKILWPKSIAFSTVNGSMMLGLGDIVIPGTFVSLALRYDYFRHTKAQPVGTFTRPYFIASLVAYVAGLATTMTVMHVFHAAQPALLYLRYDRHSFTALCASNGDAHEMGIALPVSSPLFLPPCAAGSSSKRGDGVMEQTPKMGPQWTNRLMMPPRAERPPIPRTV